MVAELRPTDPLPELVVCGVLELGVSRSESYIFEGTVYKLQKLQEILKALKKNKAIDKSLYEKLRPSACVVPCN